MNEIPPYHHTTHNIYTIDGELYIIESHYLNKFKALAEKSKFMHVGDEIIATHQIKKIKPTPETEINRKIRVAQLEENNTVKLTHEEYITDLPPHDRKRLN